MLEHDSLESCRDCSIIFVPFKDDLLKLSHLDMRRDKAVKYFKIARCVAQELSKDLHTKVGCLILAPESLEVRTLGYNGAPRGVDESIAERWEKPLKYHYISHAEMNAITNAARSGTNINGCIAVITMYPCVTCCKALIQAGIKTVVTTAPDFSDVKWGEEFNHSKEMLTESGTVVLILGEEEIRLLV